MMSFMIFLQNIKFSTKNLKVVLHRIIYKLKIFHNYLK
jgi:hypothetical protein